MPPPSPPPSAPPPENKLTTHDQKLWSRVGIEREPRVLLLPRLRGHAGEDEGEAEERPGGHAGDREGKGRGVHRRGVPR